MDRPKPIGVSPGEVVAGATAGTLAVNIGGSIVTAYWPAGYIPTVGDSVRVLRFDGSATVLGPVNTSPRPGEGTVTGAASNGMVGVTTSSGVVQARYAGTAPTPGSLVLLDWQATTARILGGAAAAVVTPPPPDDTVAPPPPPPEQITTGTLVASAVQSSTWGSASGWNRYRDEVRQWRYGSEAASQGAWFYGARLSSLRGAAVTAAQVYIPARVRIGSYNAAATLHLYYHSAPTMPSSGDVTRSGSPIDLALPAGHGGAWFPLPTATAQVLVDSGGGLAISGAPYAGVVGLSGSPQSGQLKITWRRD